MPQNPVETTLFTSKLVAGNGITLTPLGGTGQVTVAVSTADTTQLGTVTATQLTVSGQSTLHTTQVGTLTATRIASLTVSGTVVANGVTPVVVANTAVTASSQILFTLKTVGGTVGLPHVVAITANTGFNFGSSASDTSTYNYTIIG